MVNTLFQQEGRAVVQNSFRCGGCSIGRHLKLVNRECEHFKEIVAARDVTDHVPSYTFSEIPSFMAVQRTLIGTYSVMSQSDGCSRPYDFKHGRLEKSAGHFNGILQKAN